MSSNPQFHRVLSSHEYETYTFRKELLYDTSISGNALKLLLIMLDYGRRQNWQLRQNHLISMSCLKYTKYSSAIKSLESAGYVKRDRKKIGDSYDYQFSAFPIFLDEKHEIPPQKPFEPVEVFQTGKSKLENLNLSLSSYSNALEESTNNGQDLVSSSFEIVEELEAVKDISPSQKKTIYSKFAPDKIREALKVIDISKADSAFGLLYSALKKEYKAAPEHGKYEAAFKVYKQAEQYLEKIGTCPISLSVDGKYAYIYHGTAETKFFLRDSDFKSKFSSAINNFMGKSGKN